MPIRTPILWSEALLNAAKPNEGGALTPRSMLDSYSEITLPFGSSSQLFEEYTNASGGIRTESLLMEHLDSLAGSISYKHMLGPSVQTIGRIQERGFYIVTASVDRLDMLAPLVSTRDLRLSGQVIYTGKSSMEVAVRMESVGKGNPMKPFSMVCRDANTHQARQVNPLTISSPEERALYSMGELIRSKRQSSALRSLTRVPPSSEEAKSLHSFYLQYGQPNPRGERVWMGDTRVEKFLYLFGVWMICLPLGFTNSSMFTRGPVKFLSLDGISFARPVPIGSILRLTSHILHSTTSAQYPMLVHVGVKANVVDVQTGTEQTTNDFRFTWCQDHESPTPRRVVPQTYQEAMLWLEGKRALELGEEIRGLRN
ncbi:Thioesterase/thiol ester dehydrase-isomerase [Infundibulicybe gibba]|nr:Thioesterase/thiol ester dehydrase-isomerase [Infundibulicybe gibba]